MATLVVSESDLKTCRIVYVKSVASLWIGYTYDFGGSVCSDFKTNVASLSNGFFDRIEWLAIFTKSGNTCPSPITIGAKTS